MEFAILKSAEAPSIIYQNKFCVTDALEGITTSSAKSVLQLAFLQSLSKALLDGIIFRGRNTHCEMKWLNSSHHFSG